MLGRKAKLTLKPADATYRIRVRVTASGKKFASRWTAPVVDVVSVGMSYRNPIPRYDSFTLPDGWEVRVDSYTADAANEIARQPICESLGCPPATAGFVYVFIKLTVTNRTGAIASYYDLRSTQLVNASGVMVGTTCPVYGTTILLPGKDVAPDGSATVTVCQSISIADAYSVVMSVTWFTLEPGSRYFELVSRLS